MPRWDSASKDKQRLLIQQQQPWTKSTGPRSRYGCLVSSRNAVKKKRSFLPDVSFVSPPNQQSDTDRPLQVGDRARYIGSDLAIASIGGGKILEVFAVQRGLAQCWISGVPGLVTVPIGELQRV